MPKSYTRKELAELLEVSPTTIRNLLRECGFDLTASEFPEDEVEAILLPARKHMVEESWTLDQVKRWASEKRRELYGEDVNGRGEKERSSFESSIEDELLRVTETIIGAAVRRNMDKIPDIFERELQMAIEEGELRAAMARWEEKRLSAFKEEFRKSPPRRQGLPFTPDEVIDTEAREVSDDPP